MCVCVWIIEKYLGFIYLVNKNYNEVKKIIDFILEYGELNWYLISVFYLSDRKIIS